MNLSYLETFVTVANHRSFSGAARALNLTQPAVSKHIAVLEAIYGARLINRSSRRVELTEAGQALYRYAVEILDLMARAARDVSSFGQTIKGHLHIGASTIPGQYVLPAVLKEFGRRYPAVTIHLDITNTGSVVRQLLQETIQVGAVGAPVDHPRIAALPFAVDELVVLLPADHPLAAAKEIPPEHLAGQRVVWREPRSGTRHEVEHLLTEAGIDPASFIRAGEFGSTEAVIAAVEAGLGLSFVSRWAAEKALRGGKVVMAGIAGTPLKRRLYLIHLRDRILSPAAQAFLNVAAAKQEGPEHNVPGPLQEPLPGNPDSS